MHDAQVCEVPEYGLSGCGVHKSTVYVSVKLVLCPMPHAPDNFGSHAHG